MSSPVRVLLIDDQEDFIQPMSFWMKAKGLEVVTAKDGQSGIDLLKSGGVDVVFCDYKMPGLSGVETIRKIREFNKSIPVVMLTAHADDVRLQADAKDLDLSGLFPKMAQFSDLDSILEAIIRSLRRSQTDGKK